MQFLQHNVCLIFSLLFLTLAIGTVLNALLVACDESLTHRHIPTPRDSVYLEYTGVIPDVCKEDGSPVKQDFAVRIGRCADCGRAAMRTTTRPNGDKHFRKCRKAYAKACAPDDIRRQIKKHMADYRRQYERTEQADA